MIKIGSAISTSHDPAQAVDEVIAQSLGELDGFEAGLAFAFISADHGDGVDEIVKRLAARLDNVPLVGCSDHHWKGIGGGGGARAGLVGRTPLRRHGNALLGRH